MSKAEILAALSHMDAEERSEVLQRLCELQDQDPTRGVGPSAREKLLLDQTLAEYQRDGNKGRAWRESLRRIRATRPS